MRTPIRKPGLHTHDQPDPNLTLAKFNELKNKAERLKKISRPRAADEVRRLAEMGDFSDNAAYSMAKGRLRGINQRIIEIENHLKRAVIINSKTETNEIQLGSTVTLETNGQLKTYQILGSSETNPLTGVISHNSPLGRALINHHVGDQLVIKTAKKNIEYKIIKIQ